MDRQSLGKSLVALLALITCFCGGIGSADAQGPRPRINAGFVIVIDPGHGGTNEGCVSHDGSVHEKDLTLEVARRVRDRLKERIPHAEVLLTRDKDVTMTLAERVAFANARNADLFLSIHANASESKTQTGFETYVLDLEASSLDAANTAARENDDGFSAPKPATAVDHMVRELELVANRGRAATLARAIQSAWATKFPERFDRGVRQAPFDVLMGARMPAVLTELGFLDHVEEGALLLDHEGSGPMVEGLVEAVLSYYQGTHNRL